MLNYTLRSSYVFYVIMLSFTQIHFTKGDTHMSKNDKLLLAAGFIATLGVGILVIPKLQKKYSNHLYKSYNRKILKDEYGMEINKK